jgi:hypothetical protein
LSALVALSLCTTRNANPFQFPDLSFQGLLNDEAEATELDVLSRVQASSFRTQLLQEALCLWQFNAFQFALDLGAPQRGQLVMVQT